MPRAQAFELDLNMKPLFGFEKLSTSRCWTKRRSLEYNKELHKQKISKSRNKTRIWKFHQSLTVAMWFMFTLILKNHEQKQKKKWYFLCEERIFSMQIAIISEIMCIWVSSVKNDNFVFWRRPSSFTIELFIRFEADEAETRYVFLSIARLFDCIFAVELQSRSLLASFTSSSFIQCFRNEQWIELFFLLRSQKNGQPMTGNYDLTHEKSSPAFQQQCKNEEFSRRNEQSAANALCQCL